MAVFLDQVTFFFDTDVHKWLLHHSEEADMENPLAEGERFTLNITDQPFCVVLFREAELTHLKIYIRKEIGIFEDSPDLELEMPANGDDVRVSKHSNTIGGDPNELLGMFYAAGMTLRKYVLDHDLLEQMENMAQNEGVILKAKGEELSFRRVSGKRRPDMAGTALLGGVKMCRPYEDEVMDQWDMEMLSEEDKIARAEEGDEDMMEMLAQGYLNGDELDEDPEKAAYWFRKLADLDSPNAQFNLGLLYAKGHGVNRDFRQAAYWMQRAAENGDDDAPGLVEQYTLAADSKEKADAGDAQAQADLAGVLMMLAGSLDQAGTGDDYEMSFQLAQKSAAQNNGKGIWTLALAYEHGRGVEEDVKKAIELYRRGAKLGYAACQHSLGCYYLRGDEIDQDEETGFAWCLKAAEQGYGLAMKAVGRCYQFGNGVQDDMQKAIEWYEKGLEVEFDPELAQKVQLFKMLEANGGFAGLDDGEEEEAELPAGYEETMDLVLLAEELGYEEKDGNAEGSIQGEIDFVTAKAREGDVRAKYAAAKYFLANDQETELAEKWLQEAKEAGYTEE